MTDLTILIAVIALALWPLAFLVLRIRHERKKRRDRLDRMTKEDLEDIGTEELVIAVLIKIGCQPETNEAYPSAETYSVRFDGYLYLW